jgi:xylulokinase
MTEAGLQHRWSLGMKTSTTRGEILKSIMESVTFYVAESTRALAEMGVDIFEFAATGGGAKSDAWLQIKADIFGVPFVRLSITEGSVLGTAMLAGISTVVFSSPAEAAADFVKRGRVFDPDPHRHQIYQEKLQAYRELFPLVENFLVQHEKNEQERVLAHSVGAL